MNSINLNSLEKKAFGSLFMDGLLDIQIGLIWIIVALNLIYHQNIVFMSILFFVPLGYWVLKKKIVTPRMGIVRFTQQRRKRMINIKVIISTVILLGVIITLLVNAKLIPGIETGLPIMPVLIALKLLLLFMVLGYFLCVKRFYLYGILISGAFSCSEIMIHRTGDMQTGAIPFLIVSIIMVIVGVVLFSLFLKNYPMPMEDDHV